MGICSSPAKIASLAFKLYFFNSSSPFFTCMSSKGLPMQNNWYDVDAMVRSVIVFFERPQGRIYEQMRCDIELYRAGRKQAASLYER